MAPRIPRSKKPARNQSGEMTYDSVLAGHQYMVYDLTTGQTLAANGAGTSGVMASNTKLLTLSYIARTNPGYLKSHAGELRHLLGESNNDGVIRALAESQGVRDSWISQYYGKNLGPYSHNNNIVKAHRNEAYAFFRKMSGAIGASDPAGGYYSGLSPNQATPSQIAGAVQNLYNMDGGSWLNTVLNPAHGGHTANKYLGKNGRNGSVFFAKTGSINEFGAYVMTVGYHDKNDGRAKMLFVRGRSMEDRNRTVVNFVNEFAAPPGRGSELAPPTQAGRVKEAGLAPQQGGGGYTRTPRGPEGGGFNI